MRDAAREPPDGVELLRVPELLLELLAVADVEHEALEEEPLPVGAEDGHRLLVYPHHVRVGGDQPVLAREGLRQLVRAHHLPEHARAVVGMDQVREEPRLVPLLEWVAGQLLELRADVELVQAVAEGADVGADWQPLDERAVLRLGGAQALLGAGALDCDPGEVRGVANQVEVRLRGRARLGVEQGEGAEQLAEGRDDRRRPEPAPAEREGKLRHDRPAPVGRDVLDDHRLAAVERETAGAVLRPDGGACEHERCLGREAGGEAVPESVLLRVQQLHRGVHALVGLLDRARQLEQRRLERCAAGDQLEHAALSLVNRLPPSRLRDVEHVALQVHDAALRVVDGHRLVVHPDEAAVLGRDAVVLDEALAGLPDAARGGDHALPVVGVDELVCEPGPAPVLARPAEHRLEPRADVQRRDTVAGERADVRPQWRILDEGARGRADGVGRVAHG